MLAPAKTPNISELQGKDGVLIASASVTFGNRVSQAGRKGAKKAEKNKTLEEGKLPMNADARK